MSPTCLLRYSPMLMTGDTETFMTTIKSQCLKEKGPKNCVCTQYTVDLVYKPNTNANFW